ASRPVLRDGGIATQTPPGVAFCIFPRFGEVRGPISMSALGGVAGQRAVLDCQRAQVQDRASQAGGAAAAVEPLGFATAERPTLQGQVAGAIDIEEAERDLEKELASELEVVTRPRRRATACDGYALCQAGLAVDNERGGVVDPQGGRAGRTRIRDD